MRADELGFEPLLDPAGEPYPPPLLPCTSVPHLWDADASYWDHRDAQAACLAECPALAACRARRRQLKTLADGVWAGIIIRRRAPAEPEDPTIRQWRTQFNMTGKGQRQK